MTTKILVPYKDFDAVIELGAKWDPDVCALVVPAGVDLSLFSKWPYAKASNDDTI